MHLQNDSKVIISLYDIYNNLNLGRLICLTIHMKHRKSLLPEDM